MNYFHENALSGISRILVIFVGWNRDMDSQELQILKNKFDIVGNDPSLNRAMEMAVKFAPTDLPVLITGESGTGKENLAKIIHRFSTRKNASFVPVNCGAIPSGTVDSELFGHVKGAFTGATENRPGFFEEADKGTIFLDEIGELPPATQVKLLRVLQSGEYMKVGSTKVEHVNVRVVAATNVNLDYALQKGTFRQDLYYRIAAAQLRLPPLRERGDDIYLLFRKFTSDFSDKYGMCKVALTDDAQQMLKSYRWPGNVRQLMGFTEALTAQESMKITPTSQRIVIDAATLAGYMPREEGPNLPALYEGGGSSLNDEEKQIIFKALLDLKQKVDALEAEIHGTAPARLPHHEEQHPMEAEWQGEAEAPSSTKSFVPVEDYSEPEDQSAPEEGMTMKDIRLENIKRALEKHGGNRKAAAEELGISERTIYRNLPEEFRKTKK